MSAKAVLREFRKQRKVFERMNPDDVEARLNGMNLLIGRSKEIIQVINDIYAKVSVKKLLGDMVRGGSAKAGTYEEVVGVGLYIIQI